MTTIKTHTYTTRTYEAVKPRGVWWLGTPAARARGFVGAAYRVTTPTTTEYVNTLGEARRVALSAVRHPSTPWAEISRGYESGVRAGFLLVAEYERTSP
jgi:hypothetical protein